MANPRSVKQSEVDVLWDHLPSVFEIKPLPPDWDDEWIAIPLDSPESTILENSADEELFTETVAPVEIDASQFDPRERLPEQLAGSFPGALHKSWSSPYPPPDAFAFYLPFHYFYPRWWGIYLLAEGVKDLGEILHRNAGGQLSEPDCRTGARIFLFGHEQYHHSVESFATRLETTHRLPTYKTGFENYYQRTRNTPDWLEESMANANGFRRVMSAYSKQTQKKHLFATALKKYIENSGPGYNQGMKYVKSSLFEAGEFKLAEASHRASSLNAPEANPGLWRVLTHGFHPFRKRGSYVVYFVHKDSPLSKRIKLADRYLRYRDVARRLKERGCFYVRDGKGSHEIWRGPTGRNFSVPRHPGDFNRGTLSGILGQAGIPTGVEEFLSGVG